MDVRLPPQPWMTAPNTTAVFDALEAVGGPDCARYVGGCVRNTLMSLPAADVDISTVLLPDQVVRAVEAAGLRAVPTGLEHGTVTVISGHTPFEVTTLRRDVETDGRRAVVAFSTDWAEDAQRRDFRLNALYADREGKVFDYVGGGIEDARDGRIVFVGDAETRIREDYLRILRFFRFYAFYGRGPADPTGLAACAELKGGVKTLSAERISKELLRLLEAADPRPAVKLMDETGILQIVLPAALDRPRFEAMVAISDDPLLRLSALLPDDPTRVGALAQGLRLSNDQRERLLDALPQPPRVTLDLSLPEARAAIYQFGKTTFADQVRRALARAPERAAEAEALLALAEAWSVPRFPLNGASVAALGVPAGPRTGQLLREVETWWVGADFPATGAEAKLKQLVETGA